MKKEEKLNKIIEILENNTNCFSDHNSNGYDAIHEDQFPFIADDILNGFADVVSSFEPQRYDIRFVPDYDGGRRDACPDKEGQFVRYEDIKHLLAQH